MARGQGRRAAAGWGWRLLMLASLASCGKRMSPSERACVGALDAGNQEGAAVCARGYDETGDPALAVKAASALVELDELDDLLALAARFGDTPAGAPIWHLVGRAHEKRREADEAIAAYRRALGNRSPGDRRGAAEDAYRLSRLHWGHTRYREALEYAAQSEALAVEAKDRSRRWSALGMMFVILFDIGDRRAAERVLSLAREVVGEKKELAWLRFYDGLVSKTKDRLQLARLAFEEATALALEAGLPALVRAARLNLAEVYVALGDLAAAERCLRETGLPSQPSPNATASSMFVASQIAAARGDHRRVLEHTETGLRAGPPADWQWQLESMRGAALVALGRLADAETAYQGAVNAVEKLRTEMEFDELKSWLQSSKRAPYEALFTIRARAHRVEAALEIMQLATARTFFDALVAKSQEEGAGDPASGSDLAKEAIARADALRKFMPTVHRSGTAETRSMNDLLAAAGGRTVLAYFRTGESVWLAAVGSGRARLTELTIPGKQLDALVARHRAARDDRPLLDELGAALLPEEFLPEPGAPLYIAADGVLGHVSFATLRRRSEFLVERYDVSYLPGLSSVIAMNGAAPRPAAPPVVLGDPTGDLPAAADEARLVAKTLGVPALLGEKATRSALRSAARSRLLHVAAHAGVDRLGTYLTLFDGKVRAGEIIDWRVAPETAVIASCSSAARPGDDLWTALAGAFVTSGTTAVVATLRPIDDKMANRFIERFYRLDGAARPSMALARVQREQIAKGGMPSAWGAFVVVGDMRSPLVKSMTTEPNR